MSNSDDAKAEYVRQIQQQIMSILDEVKGEIGVEVPIDIEIKEVDSDD